MQNCTISFFLFLNVAMQDYEFEHGLSIFNTTMWVVEEMLYAFLVRMFQNAQHSNQKKHITFLTPLVLRFSAIF